MWYFILLLFIIYRLKNKNRKIYLACSAVGVLLFIVCSTSYIPLKLIDSIEQNFDPLTIQKLDNTKCYYIYVLGAGSVADNRLPATMNLSTATLTRLVEGVRIYNQLNKRILVTSAASKDEFLSQAKISKEAAVSLGVKERDIQMLETPTTTLEEAKAFKKRFGINKTVILVTSAMHMPRAVEIFSDQGIKVIPAPTDYLYKEANSIFGTITFPCYDSINLLNNYQSTVAKIWYYRWFKKPNHAT